jgi:hypothetical protein
MSGFTYDEELGYNVGPDAESAWKAAVKVRSLLDSFDSLRGLTWL